MYIVTALQMDRILVSISIIETCEKVPLKYTYCQLSIMNEYSNYMTLFQTNVAD